MSGPERVTLAMTGASGAPYGLRLLDCLVREDREVHFLISKAAQLVLATETDVALPAKVQSMQAFLTEYTGAAAGQNVESEHLGSSRTALRSASRARYFICFLAGTQGEIV
jgi:3-polyprenyl-4-hydroxybenzoate decarboxylase